MRLERHAQRCNVVCGPRHMLTANYPRRVSYNCVRTALAGTSTTRARNTLTDYLRTVLVASLSGTTCSHETSLDVMFLLEDLPITVYLPATFVRSSLFSPFSMVFMRMKMKSRRMLPAVRREVKQRQHLHQTRPIRRKTLLRPLRAEHHPSHPRHHPPHRLSLR